MTVEIREINLDMDGTFASLYEVEDWLSYLQTYNPYPYMVAKPMVNLSVMARRIHQLQKLGYKVNIISWLSKCSNDEYDELVTFAKMRWLKKHLPSVQFDNISIVPYGTPKSTLGKGILFDDELNNRIDWENQGGVAFDEKELLKMLKNLVDR